MDFKDALKDPAGAFHSPDQIVRDQTLSNEEKLRLLDNWEQDAIQLQRASAENMTGGEDDRLQQIRLAKDSLTKQSTNGVNGGSPADQDSDIPGPAKVAHTESASDDPRRREAAETDATQSRESSRDNHAENSGSAADGDRSQASKISDPDELPSPEGLPEVRIYSHSNLFYWWPAWVVGYALAALSFFSGGVVELDEVRNEFFHPSSLPGIGYVSLLLTLVFFTNVKLRGIYSIALILVLALIGTVFAWLEWWDDIFGILPLVSVHMNLGFYLVFSTGLFLLWALMFFIFDRFTWWRIRPGQMIEERLIGSGEKSYDAKGMLFEQRSEDFFRHKLIGLGAGDLVLMTSGARQENISIPNVLFVESKVRQIQRLVAIKPDDLMQFEGHD